MNTEFSHCLICHNECNIHSQVCGICLRNFELDKQVLKSKDKKSKLKKTAISKNYK